MKKLTLISCLCACLAVGAQTYTFDFSKPLPAYTDSTGYGYDFGTSAEGGKPFYFSVKVPDGNYRVTATVGNKKKAASTTLRAESRRLMAENVATKKGKTQVCEFVVNKRDSIIKPGVAVKIKPEERNSLTWDDRLTIEVTGEAPSLLSLTLERDDTVPTLFLCGNSTVVDQGEEPWASWGQMLPRWFDSSLSVANYAHSGLALSTFSSQKRLEKLLSQLKAGDYVIVEFGHNDQKEKYAGAGAWYNFSTSLKSITDQVRAKGATIIFSSPTQRRIWEADNATIKETHGDYPAAMAAVAERENVPLIDLHGMTRTFFETLGFEDSKKALVHYPANTFPGQTKALSDNTHFNPYGAYEVAKMVVMGLKGIDFPAITSLRPDFVDYDPAQPDDPALFIWTPSMRQSIVKPAGN